MREHGVKVETRVGGAAIGVRIGGSENGPNPESPAFQEAQKSCQGLMPGPKGARFGVGAKGGPGSKRGFVLSTGR